MGIYIYIFVYLLANYRRPLFKRILALNFFPTNAGIPKKALISELSAKLRKILISKVFDDEKFFRKFKANFFLQNFAT